MSKKGKKEKKLKLKYDFGLFEADEETYHEYWESIQDEFPKKFAKAYWGTKYSEINHFHNYRILRLSMLGNHNIFDKSEDTIEMLIGGATGLYGFTFSKIHSVSFSLDVPVDCMCEDLLPDILQSLIGISEEGKYIFEFVTIDEGRFGIEFEEIRVVEHALNSYVHQQQSEN
jgi:hypothetical protein